MRWRAVGGVIAALVAAAEPAWAEDAGGYGRFRGDVTLIGEVGVSVALSDRPSRGESFAARVGALYLHTVGIYGQYNESFGVGAQAVNRALVGGVEVRPFFLGRFARDMEHGPAYLDLFVDSIGLGIGVFGLWRNERFCVPMRPDRNCTDHGMELSLGAELPLLPQANTPFIALRTAVRWTLDGRTGAMPAIPPVAMITLTLGYHHTFGIHIVDAADRSPSP